jgi:hypothetical protein
MTYGEITLTIDLNSTSSEFDPQTTTATILGRDVALRDTNVVLIDGADSDTPRIVTTEYLDPYVVGRDPVIPVVKRSPELFDFLQCGAAQTDARLQLIVTLVCAQMRP